MFILARHFIGVIYFAVLFNLKAARLRFYVNKNLLNKLLTQTWRFGDVSKINENQIKRRI